VIKTLVISAAVSLSVLVFLGFCFLFSQKPIRVSFKNPGVFIFARVAKIKGTSKNIDRLYLVSAGIGVLVVQMISQGTLGVNGVILGLGVGLGIAKLYLFIRSYALKAAKLRETAVLYLLTNLGLRSGYTLPQSLREAMTMTPGLARHIEKCLELWPQNPFQALEHLRLAINLPEADALISVFMQVQELGASKLGGAMEEGSRHLQSLRRALVKSQAAGRPLAFSVFRMLPLLGILGIVIGPLVIQLTKLMGQIFQIF
jgi:hypothetical protein